MSLCHENSVPPGTVFLRQEFSSFSQLNKSFGLRRRKQVAKMLRNVRPKRREIGHLRVHSRNISPMRTQLYQIAWGPLRQFYRELALSQCRDFISARRQIIFGGRIMNSGRDFKIPSELPSREFKITGQINMANKRLATRVAWDANTELGLYRQKPTVPQNR